MLTDLLPALKYVHRFTCWVSGVAIELDNFVASWCEMFGVLDDQTHL